MNTVKEIREGIVRSLTPHVGKDEAEAMTYEGVKVFPVKHSNILEKPKTPNDKNELTEYRQYGKK